MADTIELTAREVEDQATKAEGIAEDIEDIIKNLGNIKDAMKEEWKGEAAEAFDSSYEDKIQMLNSARETMTALAENLRNVTGTLGSADYEAANAWNK